MQKETMTLEEMKRRKKELRFTNEMIAERSGVPLGTVQKIFAGVTKAPRWETRMALEATLGEEAKENMDRFLKDQEEERAYRALSSAEANFLYGTKTTPPGMVMEEALDYGGDPKQGSYTIRDYYALPDDRRVELIDGWIYDMAAPSRVHQAILLQLHLQFAACMETHPECQIYVAPLDVRLDNDDYTMVQPDLLILCNSTDRDKRRVNGAPDFIIEILSKSSIDNDLFRKLNKYRFAGVREYWVVDPDKKRVIVYDFENHPLPQNYIFKDKVPVAISKGACVIDFAKIEEVLERYGID